MLLLVAHQVHHREPRDGMVLGAVVGAGFAAFESAGYALQTLLDNLNGQTVIALLEIEAFRAVLAPFGHITWTALIGGALFASSRDGRFRVSRGLVLTILGVDRAARAVGSVLGLGRHAHQGAGHGRGLAHRVAERAAVGDPPDRLRPDLVQRRSTTCCSRSGALIGAAWVVLAWRRYAARLDVVGHHPDRSTRAAVARA